MTTLATEMMLKFCDLSLKTIYITQKKTQKMYPFMQVLSTHQSESRKKNLTKNQIPKIAHILYKASYCVGDGVVVCCPELKINFALKLYLHLSTSFIRLTPAYRVALSMRTHEKKKSVF